MYNINDYKDAIDRILPDTSKEVDTIVEVYRVLTSPLPTTGSQSHARLSVLDTLRPQVSAMIFMLSSKINRLRTEHDKLYNAEFSRWSIAGTKRSQAEIEAQVYKDHPDWMMKKYAIDDHYQLLEFLKSLMYSIDSSKRSVIETYKDNSKYN